MERRTEEEWRNLRAERFSSVEPAPGWPPHIRTISTSGIDFLALDPRTNGLYWDGEEIASSETPCHSPSAGWRA